MSDRPERQKHVLSVFSTFAVGGPQIRLAALANHFGPALRHSIVAMDGRLDARHVLDPALDVRFPPLPRHPGSALGNIARMASFLRRSRPDVLLTSNWGTIEWAMARLPVGIPHLHMEDGFGPEECALQLRRRVWARRLLLRTSDTIVPSRVLETIARTIWRLPAGRLHYVPNGIDLTRFRSAAPAMLPEGNGKIIGTVAALRPEKNLARLLRGFALVRERIPARLVIVGEGTERASLEALAHQLGIAADCHFAGHSDAPESWLASFDVFALSSDTEQMPLSILEAAAASLPVVATDVGDVRAMLAPENAHLIVSPDDTRFAEALYAALTAPEAAAIGALNRARVERAHGQHGMFASYARLLGIDSKKREEPPAAVP